jgi:prepilin-type N-terminal cleavage/methylation domain-containing protein
MFPARVFSRQKGFSLLEAMVVMVIIALAAAVSIPALFRISRRQKVVAAAHEIQQTLLAARMRAVRANQAASLVIVPASGSQSEHELDLVAPDPFPAPTPTPLSTTFLPVNSISFVALPVNNKVTFGGDGRIISPPAPTPALITVQGPVGAPVMNQVTIQANSSGKVQVVTPAVWQ